MIPTEPTDSADDPPAATGMSSTAPQRARPVPGIAGRSPSYLVRQLNDMQVGTRPGPQGHPAYRRICQMMHRAIAEVVGHRAIAQAMQFTDHSEVELERLQSERAMEKKRTLL